MILMISDGIDIDYKLLNLLSYKKIDNDLYYFQKDGKSKYNFDDCVVIPYKKLSEIFDFILKFEHVSIVHCDSFALNSPSFRPLKTDTIYFNSDAKICANMGVTKNSAKVNFIQFDTSVLKNRKNSVIVFEKKLEELKFAKNTFTDFLVYLVNSCDDLLVGKMTILKSKNYTNLKKNDSYSNIVNYIFMGEYKPWLQITKSSYEKDHNSKVNLLFFNAWYSFAKNHQTLLKNANSLLAIENVNNKHILDYMLRLNYEKNELIEEIITKDNKYQRVVKNNIYLKYGKKYMKKRGFDNKLIKTTESKHNLNMWIILRANPHNAIKMKYNGNLYDYKLRIKVLKKNNNTYYLLKFKFPKQDLMAINGLQEMFNVLIGKKKTYLYDRKFTNVENLNNISAIQYSDEKNIFYLRNAFDGRVIFQKSNKEYYNTPKNLKISKKYYKMKSENKYIILYEKNGLHFEESAYRLFERIYDKPNVYFILRTDSPKYSEAKVRFGEKIIEPNEERYYKYVMNAKYFIGTESPIHIIGIRSYNKYVRMKAMNKTAKFIFLQHGITYSLSLKGNARNLFKKHSNINIDKIVVSSELEADHWKTYGGFSDENIYNTGLVTFDNKKIKKDAKKIVLFLTWRPWEESLLDNVENTTYYQDILNIVENLPNKKIKDNFQVILHPKFREVKINSVLNKYVANGSIDKILAEADILITDYSSVCYDSFYRGSKVIFWWNRNNQNMKKYSNKIMLTENNVFGPVVYNNNDLYKQIKNNYMKSQSEEAIIKYRKINEFNDDKNLDRLIALLKRDKIID